MSSYQDISTVSSRRRLRVIKESVNNSSAPYPLNRLSNTKEHFDFNNIRQSILEWYKYSDSTKTNWKQVCDLLHCVTENGSLQQVNHITDIIKDNIIPYEESLFDKRGYIQRLVSMSESDIEKSALNSIEESITEAIEADRVLYNIDCISKRFDVNKLITENILFEDAFEETVYSLCSFIDTYKLGYKEKYCLALESALYLIHESVDDCDISCDEYLKEKLTTNSILETVTDYFLITYGQNNTIDFINSLQETAYKDPFVRDQLDGYFDLLRKVDANQYTESTVINGYINDCSEEVKKKFIDESVLGLAKDLDQYHIMREEAEKLISMNENETQNFFDKAKEAITKIKMLPTQAVSTVKAAIAAVLVPCRAEDISRGVHNILSTIFYSCVVLGALSVGGPLAGILASVAAIVTRKTAQNVYMKDALEEWREHRNSVKRKINDCQDPEKKRRMEAYLVEVNKTLEGLEEKYKEDKRKAEEKLVTAAINPNGDTTVANPYAQPKTELQPSQDQQKQQEPIKEEEPEEEDDYEDEEDDDDYTNKKKEEEYKEWT